ncbi:MAG: hypothetical protein VX894_15540, partial [Pseudomonadota bacterium]|nr:hypothetical protein [Pseudomonadota bacterium]
ILDCKLALCHLASDMKYAGAVYEARTYGSVRGMRRKPHPTRYNPRFFGPKLGNYQWVDGLSSCY